MLQTYPLPASLLLLYTGYYYTAQSKIAVPEEINVIINVGYSIHMYIRLSMDTITVKLYHVPYIHV